MSRAESSGVERSRAELIIVEWSRVKSSGVNNIQAESSTVKRIRARSITVNWSSEEFRGVESISVESSGVEREEQVIVRGNIGLGWSEKIKENQSRACWVDQREVIILDWIGSY